MTEALYPALVDQAMEVLRTHASNGTIPYSTVNIIQRFIDSIVEMTVQAKSEQAIPEIANKVEQLMLTRTTPSCVFVVEMTEYERGMGQRPDGYLAFLTEKDANQYVNDITKDRDVRHVPDAYVSYTLLGYKLVSAAVLRKIELSTSTPRYTYIDKLKELTNE
jgi:hypothetical protein